MNLHNEHYSNPSTQRNDNKRITRSSNNIFSSSKFNTHEAGHSRGTPLPRWARFFPYEDKFESHKMNSGGQSKKNAPASVKALQKRILQEEEFQFRYKGFLHSFHVLHNVYYTLLEKDIFFQRNTFIPLRRFLNSFVPSRNTSQQVNYKCDTQKQKHTFSTTNSKSKKQKMTTLSTNDFQNLLPYLSQEYFYDQTYLPIAIIPNSSADILDRSNLVQYLARSLFFNSATTSNVTPNSTKSTTIPTLNVPSKGSAVCVLNGNKLSSSQRSGVKHQIVLKDLLFHVLWQCLALEETQAKITQENWISPISSSQLKAAQRSNVVAVETLLIWANSTEFFDSIVVFFEDPEIISLVCLDELIATFSNIRSFHKIPIALILTPIVGNEISMLSRSSMNHVVLREFDPPNNETLFDIFLNELFVESSFEHVDILPIIFGGSVLQRIETVFRQYHYSVMMTAIHIKSAISIFFSKRGSLLSSFMNPGFTCKYRKSCELFLVNPIRRSLLTSGNQTKNCDISSSNLLSQMKSMQECIRSLHISIGLMKVAMDSLHPGKSEPAHILLRSSLKQSYHIEETCRMLNKVMVADILTKETILDLLEQCKSIISNKLHKFKVFDLKQEGEFAKMNDYVSSGDENEKSNETLKSNTDKNFETKRTPNEETLSFDGSDESVDSSSKIQFDPKQLSEHEKASILQQNIDECIIILNQILCKRIVHRKEDKPIDEKDLIRHINRCFADVKNFIIDAQIRWKDLREKKYSRMEGSYQDRKEIINHINQILFEDETFLCLENMAEVQSECPIIAYPRQNVTFGLINPHCVLQCNCCEEISEETIGRIHDTCIAFHILTERHISQSDWYTIFCAKSFDFDSADKWNRFVFAVYELLHCGIVKRDRVRLTGKAKGDCYYEKIMAWSNGF